jgi:hypothetical protein
MRVLIITILILSYPIVFADLIIMKDSYVYSIRSESKFFADPATPEWLKNAQFLTITKGEETNHASYHPSHFGPPPEFKWLTKAQKPTIPSAEGCGKYPMEWLEMSTQVARLSKGEGKNSFLIEVPNGFKGSGLDKSFRQAFKKHLGDDGDDERVSACLKTAKSFSKDQVQFVYIDCDDTLNEAEKIFVKEPKKAWSLQGTFTLTDNCP